MRTRKMMNQINVVPYIDVMLVLLVIFMVTPQAMQTGNVELPSVADVPKPPSEALYVVVKADGRSFELKETATTPGKPMSNTDLQRALQAAIAKDPSRSVVVAADKSVRYEVVMDTLNGLRQAGFQKVGLQTQTSSGTR